MAQINTRQLAKFCHRFATSLKAGVDVRRLWEQETQRSMGTRRHYFSIASNKVAQGFSMAEAMRATNGYFPPLTCELVEVGEETGRLERVLFQLAETYEHQLSIRKQFLGAIAWPMLQLFAAVFILCGLILLLDMLLPTPPAILGFAGKSGAALFFFSFWSVFGFIVFAIYGISRGWAGPAPVLLALHLPYIGSCIREFALGRLAWTLSMTLDSGVDARKSMRLALRSTQNPYFMMFVDSVDDAIVRGEEFNLALAKTGAFPEDFISDLATAELSGTHSESLERMAEQYQERAQSASKAITMVISFAVWGIVMGLMVYAIISLFYSLVMSPYQDLLQ